MFKNETELFNRQVAESYDTYYATEAGMAVDRLEKQLMDELIKKIPPSELLEIGAGTGHWTGYFRSRGFHLTATDPSEHMLSVARRRGSAQAYIRAAAEELPFADESFPVVAAVTVFEFIRNPPRAIEEILRVLRPGGFFVGGFLNARSAQVQAIRTAREARPSGSADPQEEGAEGVLFKARFMTEEEIRHLLRSLRLLQMGGCVYLSPSQKILDGTPPATGVEPAFVAFLAQKEE